MARISRSFTKVRIMAKFTSAARSLCRTLEKHSYALLGESIGRCPASAPPFEVPVWNFKA
jgi:hypothetical protein